MGLPAKRWLPPQWSKCRCVLTTTSMPGEVEVLLAQWTEARIEVGHRRVQLRQPRVDQHPRIGMVDHVHVHGHPLALGEQVGDADRCDGDRGKGVHRVPTALFVICPPPLRALLHRLSTDALIIGRRVRRTSCSLDSFAAALADARPTLLRCQTGHEKRPHLEPFLIGAPRFELGTSSPPD